MPKETKQMHQLIGVDRSEASLVRRLLEGDSAYDQRVVRELIRVLQSRGVLSDFQIIEPRWETSVYPLYYWAHREAGGSKGAYEWVCQSLPRLFPSATIPFGPDQLLRYVTQLVNSEIDILIEDVDYFVFIEAKVPTPGGKVRFQTINGVHQLVRQNIQGRILERLTGKPFELATIGANNEKTMEIELDSVERQLLGLVEESAERLKIFDLAWPPPAT